MLTVAESYFESDDFCGDVILHAAVAHPLLKRLVRFECGPNSVMRADDRADALSRYLEPRVYQRNRAHLFAQPPLFGVEQAVVLPIRVSRHRPGQRRIGSPGTTPLASPACPGLAPVRSSCGRPVRPGSSPGRTSWMPGCVNRC
jgi:hypothetical protein